MLIQATTKLRNELNLEELVQKERPPLFSWHANFLRINRRKTAVLVNDASDYTVILYGMEKNDTKNWNHGEYHRDGYKAVLNLTADQENLEYNKNELNYDQEDFELKIENEVKLKDILPARIKYIYDYGDNWQHYLETEKIIEDYKSNKPTFLEGAGTDAYDAALCAIMALAYGAADAFAELPNLVHPKQIDEDIKEEGWIYYFPLD